MGHQNMNHILWHNGIHVLFWLYWLELDQIPQVDDTT